MTDESLVDDEFDEPGFGLDVPHPGTIATIVIGSGVALQAAAAPAWHTVMSGGYLSPYAALGGAFVSLAGVLLPYGIGYLYGRDREAQEVET